MTADPKLEALEELMASLDALQEAFEAGIRGQELREVTRRVERDLVGFLDAAHPGWTGSEPGMTPEERRRRAGRAFAAFLTEGRYADAEAIARIASFLESHPEEYDLDEEADE